MRDVQRFEAAWERYIGALEKSDDVRGHPDGRVRHGARRSMRAARKNLERVCAALKVECPV